LFTGDPRRDPTAQLFREVTTAEIPDELWAAARPAASGLGVGGMLTKLQAADLARRGGAATIIAHGGDPEVVLRAVRGESLGTRFAPAGTALASRERYIWSGWDGQGRLTIDAGAALALRAGSSLLPVGVASLAGEFERGDTVAIFDANGRELARGLVNYDAGDLARIRGQRSERIESILGYTYGDEAIHRNQLVLRHAQHEVS
jgi:glutamate 5-kinase